MSENIDELQPAALTLPAYAKINLGLEILLKGEDGFHELNTLFARVNLADTISINLTDSPGVSVSVTGDPELQSQPVERNLVHRAAVAYLDAAESIRGCEVHLDKVIPSGAGLGGGSSDAGTVLRGLHRAMGPSAIPEGRLSRIAAHLGSDVPFFLGNTPMLGRGRGEILDPVSVALPWTPLILMPEVHISTGEAYADLSESDFRRPPSDLVAILGAALERPEQLRRLVNSFERSTYERYPELKQARDQLYLWGADLALLSGSGSAIFGLFRETEAATSAARAIGVRYHVGAFV